MLLLIELSAVCQLRHVHIQLGLLCILEINIYHTFPILVLGMVSEPNLLRILLHELILEENNNFI